MMNFTFGGDSPWSYEQLQRQRQVAEAMAANLGTPSNVGEGLAAVGKALAVRGINKRADREEERMRGDYEALRDRTFGGGMPASFGAPTGASWSPEARAVEPSAAPRPAPTGFSIDPARTSAAPSGAIPTITAGAQGETMPGRDRDLLARTLMAEAGGEGPQGMLAAGAVINNRVRAGGYGDSLADVILKPGQFSAWNSVTGYAGGEGGLDMDRMTPSDEAYRVADALLSGNYDDPTGGATHYYNPDVADPKWGMGAGGDWERIGNHVFGFADAGRGGGGQGGASTASRTPTGGPSHNLMDLASVAGSPFASPAERSVAQALMQQQMQAMDPMRAIQMQQAQVGLARDRAELERLQNPQVDPMDAIQLEQERIRLEQMRNPAPEMTDDMREYEYARQQGYEGSFQDFMAAMRRAGSSSVTVNNGSEVGTIPQGFELFTDPETGARRMRPIAGGPAAQEAEALEASKAAAEEQKQQYGSVVFEDIGRVVEMLNGGRDEPITGVMGKIASGIPGSERADAEALVETIKANIGFDRLQAMREASPTGGALGNVTERELATLQAVMGNLSFGQSKQQLLQNLGRLEGIYRDILDKAARTGDGTFVPRAPEGGAPSQAAPAASGPDFSGATMDDLTAFDLSAATPEEVAAWMRRMEELEAQ